MTPWERRLARERARLFAVEKRAARSLDAAWQPVEGRLRNDLERLGRLIERERARGTEVRPAWLMGQREFQDALTHLQGAASFWSGRAVDEIVRAGRTAAEVAADSAARLAGVRPDPEQHAVARDVRLQLGLELLAESQQAQHELAATLGRGVAEDAPVPRLRQGAIGVARRIRNRGVAAARWHTVTTHREVSALVFLRSGRVRGWTWVATLDTNTCPICWSEHGTVHGFDELLGSHNGCRCTMAPAGPEFPSLVRGVDLFGALPDTDQRRILGPSRYGLYRSGLLDLPDLVRQTRHPVYGAGRRLVTLRELGQVPHGSR